MTTIKVDLLGTDAERQARKTTAMIAVVFAVAVGILAAMGAGASYRAATRGTTVLYEVGNLPIIAEIRKLAWGADEGDVTDTPDNRITFLLLGVGGPGHSGPQLSDTILIATADLATKKIGIVSIPRDLAFPLGGGRFIKINAVNAYAEESSPGAGARETADAFENLFGIRIDHVVRVNFRGFVDFVDALGGVDVDVERSFTDSEYPTDDYKWQVVSFKSGEQEMDGERLLTYVRSRHGSNGEAGDFSRNRRQQLAMLAIKEKLLSVGTIANPKKIVDLYETVAANIQTDMTAWEMLRLAPLIQDFDRKHIVTNVLSDGKDGELIHSNVDGAFMLFPKKPDWSEVRLILQDPFKTREERLALASPQTEVRVEIRNGTTIAGFAARMKTHLEGNGYLVDDIGNASDRGYEKTVIYDLRNGAKAPELAALKTLLDANVALLPRSSDGATATGSQLDLARSPETDFLIVLGSSSLSLLGGP